MLALMERPGAERVFPDAEAVKAKFKQRLAVVSDPKAYKARRIQGRVRGLARAEGPENEGAPRDK
jgi:hypothetical protein